MKTDFGSGAGTLRSSFVAIAVLVIIAFAARAGAQSTWPNLDCKSSVSLRYANPSFDTDGNWNISGELINLNISGELSEGARLIVDMPYAHYREPSSFFGGGGRTENMFGNPYLGARLSTAASNLSCEFGFRLPLAGNEKPGAAMTGLLSDLDQMEAFISDYLPVHVGISIKSKNSEGLFARISANQYAWFYVGDDKRVDATEFVLHYGAIGGFENQNIRLQGGITGLSILSEGDAFTDEATLHQFGMELDYRLGNFWPGMHFRVPLDDEISQTINLVWGISITYASE